jgi:ribonuclease P protein component
VYSPGAIYFCKNMEPIAKQFTLGKNERLKSRKLIERVFREGKNFALYPYRVYYINGILRPGSSPHPVQFGVGIGKKNFKKAVDRNRIKRLTREAYRLQKKILQENGKQKDKQLALFLIYTGKELPEYDKLYEKIGVILKKLVTITDENNADPA